MKARRRPGSLGFKEVESLGYRAGELGGVSPTELRDRILFYIRLYKPTVMFIPNPYAEYVEALDRFYVGQAAEDARRAASLSNYQPPFAVVGLETHVTPELYYYAQPFDPRRREAESSATFVPQPKILDIASTSTRSCKRRRRSRPSITRWRCASRTASNRPAGACRCWTR